MGFINARMNISAGLSASSTTLSLLARLFPRVVLDGGVILVPDLATVHCGQRYDRKAGEGEGEGIF